MSFFTIATLFPSTWLQMSFLWKKWMGKYLDIVSDSFFLLNFVVTDLKPYLVHAIATHFFLCFLTKDKCITHSVLWRVFCVLWTNIFRHNSFTHSTLLCISFCASVSYSNTFEFPQTSLILLQKVIAFYPEKFEGLANRSEVYSGYLWNIKHHYSC